METLEGKPCHSLYKTPIWSLKHHGQLVYRRVFDTGQCFPEQMALTGLMLGLVFSVWELCEALACGKTASSLT